MQEQDKATLESLAAPSQRYFPSLLKQMTWLDAQRDFLANAHMRDPTHALYDWHELRSQPSSEDSNPFDALRLRSALGAENFLYLQPWYKELYLLSRAVDESDSTMTQSPAAALGKALRSVGSQSPGTMDTGLKNLAGVSQSAAAALGEALRLVGGQAPEEGRDKGLANPAGAVGTLYSVMTAAIASSPREALPQLKVQPLMIQQAAKVRAVHFARSKAPAWQ